MKFNSRQQKQTIILNDISDGSESVKGNKHCDFLLAASLYFKTLFAGPPSAVGSELELCSTPIDCKPWGVSSSSVQHSLSDETKLWSRFPTCAVGWTLNNKSLTPPLWFYKRWSFTICNIQACMEPRTPLGAVFAWGHDLNKFWRAPLGDATRQI